MNKSSLFIPQKVKVGYQSRDGTYTGRLAYVIYYDNKGKLRKEASWQNWRSKDIDPDEFDNVPTDGFVLNKKVGGYKSHWDFRQAYVRVYDPRGFEFEITVPNLLFILENTSSIKGKGLEGEFVYAWSGTELVLLPIDSPDYEALTKLNEKRFSNEKIKARDLKIGATYLSDNNTEWVYMGRFDYYERGYTCGDKWFISYKKCEQYANEIGAHRAIPSPHWYYPRTEPDITYGVANTARKKHCFYNRANNDFVWADNISKEVVDLLVEDPAADYAELFEKLEHNERYSPYDSSRDKIDSPSTEEMANRIKNLSWGVVFEAENGNKVRIKEAKENDELVGYTCTFEYGYNFDMRDFFEHKRIDYPDSKFAKLEMIPVSLEEINAKFCFKCTRRYLANGKYLDTRWN